MYFPLSPLSSLHAHLSSSSSRNPLSNFARPISPSGAPATAARTRTPHIPHAVDTPLARQAQATRHQTAYSSHRTPHNTPLNRTYQLWTISRTRPVNNESALGYSA